MSRLRDVPARSIANFIAAAVAEIGGAYLVWLGIKEHKGVAFVALGAMALAAYGSCSSSARCCGGIAFDGFQPDRAAILGALVCLTGVGIIMYAR